MSGNPKGRVLGSRAKFSEQFVSDLADAWSEHGEEALRRVAVEEPAQFLRCCVMVMPKDLNLNIGLSAEVFVADFRRAVALLHERAPPPAKRLPKVIDAD